MGPLVWNGWRVTVVLEFRSHKRRDARKLWPDVLLRQSALPTSPFQHTRDSVDDQAYHGLRLALRGRIQNGFGRRPFRDDPISKTRMSIQWL